VPDSLHLVDAALRGLLELWPKLVLSDETLPLLRTPNRLPIADDPATTAAVDELTHVLPGSDGAPEVAMLSYRPIELKGTLPCIFHIHGGGFVAGSAASMAPIHRAMVLELGCMLVSVDYRLAPETSFPGAIEDCDAALRWLFDQAETLGIDPRRIGVMGESAGGGLAAALVLMLRDRAGPALAFQHLVYPMLDDRTCVAQNPHPLTGGFIWTLPSNIYAWTALLGEAPGSAAVSPYAAPARATDLSGLPPTFVSCGALDLFLEEDIDYARRLTRAGVATELHVYPGAYHGFDLASGAAVAQQARRDSLDALRRFLHPVG